MGILIRRRVEFGSALPTRCSLYCHTVALPSETLFFFMIIVYIVLYFVRHFLLYMPNLLY